MSSGLTDDDKERIATFCETPPYDRSPDDLTPDPDDAAGDGDAPESLLGAVWHRLRRR